MSLRSGFSGSVQPQFGQAWDHGGSRRGGRPTSWAGWTLGALAVAFGALSIGSAASLVFRNEIFVALMQRQSEMQVAYEDRISLLRAKIDALASRQLLDQDTVEGKLHDVAARQAQLENRAALVAALAEGAGLLDDRTSAIADAAAPAPRPSAARATPGKPPASAKEQPKEQPKALVNATRVAPAQPAPAPAISPALPLTPAGGAPHGLSDFATPRSAKPQPEAMEIAPSRGAMGAPARLGPRASLDADAARRLEAALPAPARLAAVSASVARVEATQLRTVAAIGKAAQIRAASLSAAIGELGLRVERFAPPRGKGASAVGGPFVPFKLDASGSAFEREVLRLQSDVQMADRLRRAFAMAPVGRPLGANAETTSGFGARMDPFLGRLAYHGGLDFREAYGAPVRATGAGQVVTSGAAGGYGNLVEIDHGAGLSTRYGHMSALLVQEGQWVEAGTVVGRLGSTGRSTGPHLHYEVRVDDEPVDPMRFIRAGARHRAHL